MNFITFHLSTMQYAKFSEFVLCTHWTLQTHSKQTADPNSVVGGQLMSDERWADILRKIP